jgi:hypothetical protein
MIMEPYLFHLFTLSKIVLYVAIRPDVLFTQLLVVDASKVEVGKAAGVLGTFFTVIDFALCAEALAPEAHDTFSVYGPSTVHAVCHFEMVAREHILNLMYVMKNNSSYSASCYIGSIAEKDDLWQVPQMQDKERA